MKGMFSAVKVKGGRKVAKEGGKGRVHGENLGVNTDGERERGR